MGHFKKKILIDLDGVLNKYGQEQFVEDYIPDIRDGAYEFVKELSQFIASFNWQFYKEIGSVYKDLLILQYHTLYNLSLSY